MVMTNEPSTEDWEAPLTKDEEKALAMQRRRFLRNKAQDELALQRRAAYACIVIDRATGKHFLMASAARD